MKGRLRGSTLPGGWGRGCRFEGRINAPAIRVPPPFEVPARWAIGWAITHSVLRVPMSVEFVCQTRLVSYSRPLPQQGYRRLIVFGHIPHTLTCVESSTVDILGHSIRPDYGKLWD